MDGVTWWCIQGLKVVVFIMPDVCFLSPSPQMCAADTYYCVTTCVLAITNYTRRQQTCHIPTVRLVLIINKSVVIA